MIFSSSPRNVDVSGVFESELSKIIDVSLLIFGD
jgi:hypothetical protein